MSSEQEPKEDLLECEMAVATSSNNQIALTEKLNDQNKDSVENSTETIKDSLEIMEDPVETMEELVEGLEDLAEEMEVPVEPMKDPEEALKEAVEERIETVEERVDTMEESIDFVEDSVLSANEAIVDPEETAETVIDSVQTKGGSVTIIDSIESMEEDADDVDPLEDLDPILNIENENVKNSGHLDSPEIILGDSMDHEDSIDNDCILEESVTQLPKPPGQDPSQTEVPNIIQKDVPSFRMNMSKDDIEKMISEGTLEKVSEGYYKVKADSLKEIKVAGKSIFEKKEDQEIVKPGPLSKKKIAKKGKVLTQCPIQVTNIGAPLPLPQTSVSPSYIALMPVNQAAAAVNSNNNAFIALPMQQNVSYDPTLPTYVAFPQPNVSTIHPEPKTITPPPSITLGKIKITNISPELPAPTSIQKPTEPAVERPGLSFSNVPQSSVLKQMLNPKETSISHLPPAHSSDRGTKRKPYFESTKVKRPYKFAKPLKKKKSKTKAEAVVSDFNTSDDEQESPDVNNSKAFGMELSSMFFKKIGDPKKTNKSLLDKLHKAIFQESTIESDEDSEVHSDVEEAASAVKSGKSNYRLVNCPGPDQFEAYVGPGNNSKLSIIRCQEVRKVKSFMYEIYKIRVTSAGREANTNILIPIPEGYKYQLPAKAKEERVEFTHVAHEDHASSNYVNPLFLEKLAKTELKLRKYKDEIKALRSRYLELLQEYSNRPQFSTISDLVGASAKFLTDDQLIFFLMQLKAGAHNMQGIRYSVREKVLALSIYQKSPDVYKWFRKMFNLPSKRILDQWLEDVGLQDPQLLKKLMYYVYTTYNFKADS